MSELMEPEKKSTHKVEIVPFKIEKHPNADKLGIVQVFGYVCCVNLADWPADTAVAAYLPPDSYVDTKRPEFAFLAGDAKDEGWARVRPRKFRNIQSFGCLVKAPEGSKIGDDVADLLNVKHYEPPIPGESSGPNKQKFAMGGEVASPPSVFTVKYDVDALRRYHKLFEPNEPVIITEKLDGANSRYVYHDGKMHCGSRTEWKKEYPDYSHITVDKLIENGVPADRAADIFDKVMTKPKKQNMWWSLLERDPTLAKFCMDNPGVVVYGEAFGNVGRIKYGPDRFAAFDLMDNGIWVDGLEARERLINAGVPCVPLIAKDFPYDFEKLCAMAEGTTFIEDAKIGTIREGIVVKPIKERRNYAIGRVQLKCVSAAYLEKY